MSSTRTDVAWQRWGEQRPYFGVLTSGEYDEVQRGDAAWERFMATGEAQLAPTLERLSRVGAPTRFARALDFGCGVGRLLPPLAGISDQVVGVDVSAGMRAEAAANLAHLGVANATVLPSDDALSHLAGTFDLIHTYAVLQHVEPRRGLAITRRLLELAAPGAALSLHYCDRANTLSRRVKRVVGRSERATRVANRLRGARPDAPPMQTYPYRLAAVTGLLRAHGVTESLVTWARHGRASFFQLHAVMPE